MSTASTTFPGKHQSPEAESMTLLERIGSGDHAAVSECIARYGDLVWYLAKKFSSSDADAEDATQEIFLEIWQKAKSFDRSLASEETFLAMVARRRLIDRRRRSTSGVQTVAIDGEHMDTVELAKVDHVELSDEAAKAAHCMEKLTDQQRSILTLSIQQGQSHTSISSRLEMPLGTVKSFARRGLLQLRDCMNRNSLLTVGGRAS